MQPNNFSYGCGLHRKHSVLNVIFVLLSLTLEFAVVAMCDGIKLNEHVTCSAVVVIKLHAFLSLRISFSLFLVSIKS